MKSTSVSVKATTHARLEAEAERRGIAVSSLVELAIAAVLDIDTPKPRAFRRRRSRKVSGT